MNGWNGKMRLLSVLKAMAVARMSPFNLTHEDFVEEGYKLSVRIWLEARTDTGDESRTVGMEQAR